MGNVSLKVLDFLFKKGYEPCKKFRAIWFDVSVRSRSNYEKGNPRFD